MDRNDCNTGARFLARCRSLRGNVDRNRSDTTLTTKIRVVPYVGTWIEISQIITKCHRKVVVPYVGTWIEMFAGGADNITVDVVPYVGTWIEMWIHILLKANYKSFPTWERG